ncbi:hypothetical protein GJ496_004517 [Pomphorhynchus laevis]|nr:hypothetical protein GJ496_004517 [Pomphorhynchus laevis]
MSSPFNKDENDDGLDADIDMCIVNNDASNTNDGAGEFDSDMELCTISTDSNTIVSEFSDTVHTVKDDRSVIDEEVPDYMEVREKIETSFIETQNNSVGNTNETALLQLCNENHVNNLAISEQTVSYDEDPRKRIHEWLYNCESKNITQNRTPVHNEEILFHGKPFVIEPRCILLDREPNTHYLEDPRRNVYFKRLLDKLRSVALRFWSQKFYYCCTEADVMENIKKVVVCQKDAMFWDNVILLIDQPIRHIKLAGDVAALTPLLGMIFGITGNNVPKLIPSKRYGDKPASDPRLERGNRYCQRNKNNSYMKIIPQTCAAKSRANQNCSAG